MRWAWLSGVALFLAAAAVAAQKEPVPPRSGDVVDWHEVQRGETLENITAHYLGSPLLWQENWRLNPDLVDPHRLLPGQRLRVIVRREVKTAEIKSVARKVEEKAQPQPWAKAQSGDKLKTGDGLRTYEKSSAELAFDDESRLLVTEQSVVFLRDAGSSASVSRKSLEIVDGQADFEARASALPTSIEILVAGAKARPLAATDQPAETRARRTQEGTAQVMVYGGNTEVEAGGARVQVPRGKGSAVTPGGRPSPPEDLLPHPRLLRPAAEAIIDYSNPSFAWMALPGAASYTIEVCLDPACAQLVDRVTGLTGTDWTVTGLPVGRLFWRVTAVGRSGLDGFPSDPAPFSVRSLWRRPTEPPPGH